MNIENRIKKLPNKVLAELQRKNYAAWKQDSLNNTGFFVIFNGFLDNNYLNKISGNALKLYIFLGIKADNTTGESYYSIQSMAKYFGKSERTINNWIQELEKHHLIKRMQFEKNKVSHTFLQTYQAGAKKKKKQD